MAQRNVKVTCTGGEFSKVISRDTIYSLTKTLYCPNGHVLVDINKINIREKALDIDIRPRRKNRNSGSLV